MSRSFRLFPGAASLMLVVVVVAICLLMMLALIEVYGDYKLTERSIDFAVEEYKASVDSEYKAAELDAIFVSCAEDAVDDKAYLMAIEGCLPDNTEMNGRIVSWEQPTPYGRVLMCSVEIMPLGSELRFEWISHVFIRAE